MITSSILLIFLGCFLLYYTSKKVLLTNNLAVEKWVQSNVKPSKIIAFFLLIVALIVTALKFGKTSGFFYWLFFTTTILSLFTVIYPLQKVNYKHICILFCIFFLAEILL